MAESKNISDLKSIAYSLPDEPGVYQFLDKSGTLIYAGKAKSLRKRVSSYFVNNLSGKTLVMRNRVATINHIVVNSESDALLLENSIIKKYQPRYNVLMKDDKTYPWICIKKETFPRVFMTRNVIRDGSLYFGPYTSVVMVKTLLSLIRQLYKLRTCNYNLSKDKVAANRYKVCLEYHIGNCEAPCIGKKKEEDYNAYISQVKEILKGNIFTVNSYLKKLMKEYASGMKFEEAQVVKEKIEILDKYQNRSTVVNPRINNADVFAFTEEDSSVFVNYLRIIKGAIIQTHTLEIRRKIDEEMSELISLAITELRQIHDSDSKEIILPLLPDIQEYNVKYTVPRKGDKLRLIELAERNAVFYRLNKKKKEVLKRPEERIEKNLGFLQKDLRLSTLPIHIECFDNSNIQGTHPVAACVVFKNGKPKKREYRHYNIKSVEGADDFASMEEVVFRRYRRLIDEDEPLPQLIVIDGGKGQLSAAVKSLEALSIRNRVAIVGIAKKLEEIYFPDDPVPLYIDKNSYSLKLIQQLRNEAHRFGITFHRDKRSKSMVISELDKIPGIGPATKEILIKKFGSVEKIREAGESEVEKIVGRSKSLKIREYFKNLL